MARGRVYVATENDTVYALSAATGAVVWSTHLASPVPASLLPCGDIRPTVGITGTPVIDTARGEIFVVADELVDGKAAHVVVGLSTATGKLEMSQDVDPAGADPLALLQRTGLTLDQGRRGVRVRRQRRGLCVLPGPGGVGGRDRRCAGRLHRRRCCWPVPGGRSGWAGRRRPSTPTATSGSRRGTGRSPRTPVPYDDSDSVLELSPSLRARAVLRPGLVAGRQPDDLDMSTEPVLLGDGGVLIAGKSRIAYLLDGSRLGGHRRPAGLARVDLQPRMSTAAAPRWARRSTSPV